MTHDRLLQQARDEIAVLRAVNASVVAEAERARRAAEEANSARSLFLRAMSHELRTPLNAIAGYADLLEMGIRGPVNEAQSKDLSRIKRASTYLLHLINDVLTVARLEGAPRLDLSSVGIKAMLGEVEGLCELQARANGLTLTLRYPETEIFAAANAERLQQCLLNLITNAIKFTPRGGRIDVSCERDDRAVRVIVADSGVGLRPGDLERIFEPFVQIDRHLTPGSLQGVGLGLSISRELVRSMQGDLTVTSEIGNGATFTLSLPIASKETLTPSSVGKTAPVDDALFSPALTG